MAGRIEITRDSKKTSISKIRNFLQRNSRCTTRDRGLKFKRHGLYQNMGKVTVKSILEQVKIVTLTSSWESVP